MVVKYIEGKDKEDFLTPLVVKDIEGQVKEETIKEDGLVMRFVLKGLCGKIRETKMEKFLEESNVPSIF